MTPGEHRPSRQRGTAQRAERGSGDGEQRRARRLKAAELLSLDLRGLVGMDAVEQIRGNPLQRVFPKVEGTKAQLSPGSCQHRWGQDPAPHGPTTAISKQ